MELDTPPRGTQPINNNDSLLLVRDYVAEALHVSTGSEGFSRPAAPTPAVGPRFNHYHFLFGNPNRRL